MDQEARGAARGAERHSRDRDAKQRPTGREGLFSLTPPQMACARAIAAATVARDQPPSLAELAQALGVCVSSAVRLVAALTERGWLEPRRAWAGRALALTPPAAARLIPPGWDCAITVTPAGRAYLLADKLGRVA